MDDMTRMLIALGIGLVMLIVLIIRTKTHPVLALVLVSAFIGIAGGVEIVKVPGAITTGFGNTLASIGLVIGFGVMMGQIMEDTGAAKVLARTFLRICGKGREEWALALTGFVTSIPIFCDSAFVILAPLAKAISKSVNKSIIGLGVVLAACLMVTHSTVPPTPGPLGVAGIFEINIGLFILFTIALGIPVMVVLVLFSKWVSRRYFAIPDEDGMPVHRPYEDPRDTEYLKEENTAGEPTPLATFLPIVLPVVLILFSTVVKAIWPKSSNIVLDLIAFFGNPVISVAIGLIFAIYGLTANFDRTRVRGMMEKGIRSCGTIILITGAGGSLGQVIRVSGAGDVIANALTQMHVPPILLPFIIAGALRFIQGSGTVAMITTASITFPILSNMDVNLMFAAYATCIGSQVVSYHNDSYFWVVNTTLGITDTKEQLVAYSLASPIFAFTALAELLIVNAIFG